MWELLQSRTLQLILENVGTITNHGLYSWPLKMWELLQITDFTVDP